MNKAPAAIPAIPPPMGPKGTSSDPPVSGRAAECARTQFAISANPVCPVNTYTNPQPNNNTPELKAPNKKYLNPASVLCAPTGITPGVPAGLRIAANTYKDKLNNSIAKYKGIKSLEETNNSIPNVANRINNVYSGRVTPNVVEDRPTPAS